TKRQGAPMCGIPYHAAKPYIARLLKAGRKVAICEQLSLPGAKGIMARDVVEVVTPGTTIEEDFLSRDAANYLVCVCSIAGRACISCLDVSTGDFRAYSCPDKGEEGIEFFRSELSRLAPRELIIQQSLSERPELANLMRELGNPFVERRPDWSFDPARSASRLAERFGLASLKGFGFSGNEPELAAAGLLLEYLDDNAKTPSPHIRSLLPYDRSAYLSLDEATRRNLELVRNLSDSSPRDSLFGTLDRTKTAGGHRTLRSWILQPLQDLDEIGRRLDAVEALYKDQIALAGLRKILSTILDTERLAARLSMDKAHAKDLLALRDSLSASIAAVEFLMERKAEVFSREVDPESLEGCKSVVKAITDSIKADPSILLTEGNIMRDGFDPELDRLRALKHDSTKVLEAYLEEERQSSGIPSLRIRYNKIIGYYLEVTKGKLDAVPSRFIRRQSLVTGERYTTERLANLESEINGASERIAELEKRLFLELRARLKSSLPAVDRLAKACSRIDCIASFAQAATEGAYTRPVFVSEPCILIRQGRHPVVEACLPQGRFVPNDIELGGGSPSFALITGPNMAGKSTILRQTALIALMAHMGSFVPAEEARIGRVDKIFCRVGAQDNLARGESTFLVEMHETAYILNTATPRSLVVMDEVGRGTGTLDGLSLAWAISERLLDTVGCRTLFATHYHELTSLKHPGLVNLSMDVLEREGEIVFLKRLKTGPAAGSYGLHVARLAGIPPEVLSRAAELQGRLSDLEKGLSSGEGGRVLGEISSGSRPDAGQGDEVFPAPSASAAAVSHPVAELFSGEDLAISRLRSLDIESTTPLEALRILSEIKSWIEP
ncbi:MAG TPA: DNA mismatch repair protein MutS, partial [Rectinemataceae bacterium]